MTGAMAKQELENLTALYGAFGSAEQPMPTHDFLKIVRLLTGNASDDFIQTLIDGKYLSSPSEITLTEFLDVMRPKESTLATAKNRRLGFKGHDLNSDEELTLEEFKASQREKGFELTDVQCEKLFQLLDIFDDGTVYGWEFQC